MLPSQIYEPLPYAYLGIGLAGAIASEFSGPSMVFTGVLVGTAIVILRMRYTYRRQRNTIRSRSGTQHARSGVAARR